MRNGFAATPGAGCTPVPPLARFRGGGLDRAALIQKSIPLQKRFSAYASNISTARMARCGCWLPLVSALRPLVCIPRTPRREPTKQQRRAGVASCGDLAQGLIRESERQRRGATARLLTATRTCVIQRRNALEFLTTPCGGTGPASPPCRCWSRRRGAERLLRQIQPPGDRQTSGRSSHR